MDKYIGQLLNLQFQLLQATNLGGINNKHRLNRRKYENKPFS